MIRNITRKTTISSSHREVRSALGKAKGLIGQFSVKEPLVFVLDKEQRIDLHMLFVLCRIDVLLLDTNKTVVEMKERLMPFSFFLSRKKAKYVIELAEGSIRKSKTAEGDRIGF